MSNMREPTEGTWLIDFPPRGAGSPTLKAGHFTDPLPGERAWVPIDGLMIRGFTGGPRLAYLCGLQGSMRSQAMLQVPMDPATLNELAEVFRTLSDMARSAEEQQARFGNDTASDAPDK